MPPLIQYTLFSNEGRDEISETFSEHERIVVQTGDALEVLSALPPDLVTLIVTSPPYNLGKSYETRVDLAAYLRAQEPIIEQLVRVMHPQGHLCWQVGNYIEDGEVVPLDCLYHPLFSRHGLKLRRRCLWHYAHGLHEKRRFSGRYETLSLYTKAEFLPARLPALGDPLPESPSQLSAASSAAERIAFAQREWAREVWDIPNVNSSHSEKTEHPCQFPIELVERCVLVLSDEDDWILDPFCGVGAALVAGLKYRRRVIGCDKEARYTTLTKERIVAFLQGKLPMRAMGTPIYVPSKREKITQSPSEWRKEVTAHQRQTLFQEG